MKILFVRSGNNGIDPISQNQGESLVNLGVNVDYFNIIGKGIFGYLSNITELQNKIKIFKPDIIHAHYSSSAFLTSLASLNKLPVVTSLMGSDVESTGIERLVIKLFFRLFWKKLIVKSENMKLKLNEPKVNIIPNGINFKQFQYIPQNIARKKLGYSLNKKYIIWISDPKRKEKNFELAEKAFNYLDKDKIVLKVVNGIKHEEISYYYYAADCLLLTSLWEGSPNVIKETLVCNCPIVATNVGDVKDRINGIEGCFLTTFDENQVSKKIKMALKFNKPIKGRERIVEMGLESEKIAKQIIEIYNKIIWN